MAVTPSVPRIRDGNSKVVNRAVKRRELKMTNREKEDEKHGTINEEMRNRARGVVRKCAGVCWRVILGGTARGWKECAV